MVHHHRSGLIYALLINFQLYTFLKMKIFFEVAKKYLSKIYKNFLIKDFACPSFFIEELSLVDKNNPLLLITDMSFGENEIDGIALIDYLKKLQFSNFEVIMITGFGSIETAINATKRGIFKYLTKPFSLEDIRVVISECLGSFQDSEKHQGEVKVIKNWK